MVIMTFGWKVLIVTKGHQIEKQHQQLQTT